MVFEYPLQPLARRHGPAGYVVPASYKDWLRDEFSFRCVYCLARERWYPNGQQAFGVEHVQPAAHFPDLIRDYDNLVYACVRCNSYKRDTLVLDPREAAYGEHLRMLAGSTLEGLTAEGRELIRALQLNDALLLQVREHYSLLALGARNHPRNQELQRMVHDAFAFPDDLPNLAALRRAGNTRPDGVATCFFQLRAEGRLPATY